MSDSNNEEKSMLPAKATSFKDDLLYKLRLSKLDPTQRTLQNENAVDSQGFLTPVGAMAYLDYLWQRDPEAQKELANSLRKLKKDNKKSK